jgi:osmotically-inducible protein OsmY
METTEDRVRDDVRAQLASDPRLPYPDEIAINYDGFAVTLRGTVGSFAQLRAAVADARRTPGVEDVFDELQVRILDVDRRRDAEIRGAALQRLISDAELADLYVDVSVKDGWVTLKGEVGHQHQSDAAFDRVASLTGASSTRSRSPSADGRDPALGGHPRAALSRRQRRADRGELRRVDLLQLPHLGSSVARTRRSCSSSRSSARTSRTRSGTAWVFLGVWFAFQLIEGGFGVRAERGRPARRHGVPRTRRGVRRRGPGREAPCAGQGPTAGLRIDLKGTS